MKKSVRKLLCICLSALLLCGYAPLLRVLAASPVEIYQDDTVVTEKISLQEYRTVQLSAVLSEELPADVTVAWKSNLPLLANVSDTGLVTAYDYSKTAVIRLWIDENIATLPLIGQSTADAIWAALNSSGIDLDTADTDAIVSIVSAVAGESLAESLRKTLDNMDVKITATVLDADGKVLGSDTVEVLVEKSVIASIAPTGVHITNKRAIPTTVAVGTTVQLYGACTPVRLKQGIKWAVGKNAFDTSAAQYATVTEDGMVTFLKPGTVAVRINPSSAAYAAFSDTVTFTVLSTELLPVKDFTITGATGVAEGATTQLRITDLTPAGAYSGDLKWESSDPSVAVVDESGIVTGLDGGSGLSYSRTVTITATIGGVTKEFPMKVNRAVLGGLSSVEITGSDSVGIGTQETLTATVFPARLNNNSGVTREWGLYDALTDTETFAAPNAPASDGIVSVNADGILTGLQSGVSVVCCKASYGNTSVTSRMRVTSGKAITDFSIDGALSLTEGQTSQLTLSAVSPEDYDPLLLKNVRWSIDDSSVASISADGLVLARDAGGRAASAKRTAEIRATISGVTRTVTVTVKGQGLLAVNHYSDAEISGNDTVIVDLPTPYSVTAYPTRIGASVTAWGLNNDEGAAPWNASLTTDTAQANLSNSNASIHSDGTLRGIAAGKVTVYSYQRYLASTFIEAKKEVNVVELIPENITLTAPKKYDYNEGETELDLTGLAVSVKYDKNDLLPYYPEAAAYTDAQLSAPVTDYTVGDFDPLLLDVEQYVVVSLNRAGQTLRAVFPICIHSKELSSLTLTAPDKAEYTEGETELSLAGLVVTANYTNAESEIVTDYTVDTASFRPDLFDEEQNISVSYSHAGRTAQAHFAVTVYGIPVLTVTPAGTLGAWTSENITFSLSATHPVDGIKYYYQNEGSTVWHLVTGNTYIVNQNTDTVVSFKAVNGKGLESEIAGGYRCLFDNTIPYFYLTRTESAFTNQAVGIGLGNIRVGKSGIASITVDGEEIYPKTTFTVSTNGIHTVQLTSVSNMRYTVTCTVNNIDTEAPAITAVSVSPASEDGFCRTVENGKCRYYFNAGVRLSVEALDTGVAGIEGIYYRAVPFSGEAPAEWLRYDAQNGSLFSEDGFQGYLECRVIDGAGNISAYVSSPTFAIDTQKPVISDVPATSAGLPYTNDTWASDAVVFTPAATASSGIFGYQYCLDGGDWIPFTADFLYATEDGTHTYSFRAISYSGLESDVFDFSVNIDRTTPEIRVDFEGTFGRWTSEEVTFTLSTLSESPSGITYYYDCGDGWTAVTGSLAAFNENTDAFYRFKAVNGAGTESRLSDAYRVMIDTVEPYVQPVPGVTQTTAAPYSVAFLPVTGASGIKKVYFNGEDVTTSLSATVTHNGKYILTVIGNNLLSATTVVEIKNFGDVSETLYEFTKVGGVSHITAYNGNDTKLTVPFTLGGGAVTALKEGAFRERPALTEVLLPNGLSSIADLCFMNDTALTTVLIPSSVTEIGEYAFFGCAGFTILCYPGSTAQAYAVAHDIPYTLLSYDPVGRTEIDLENHLVFTENASCGNPGQLVRTDDSYQVIGIPTLYDGSTQYFGTGSKLYYFCGGMLKDTFTLIVRGDLTGDSVVDVFDCTLAELTMNSHSYLFDSPLLAADFDGSSEVEITDYQAIVNRAVQA